MKALAKPLKIAALVAIVIGSTGFSSSTINYRIHYLTEAGNSNPPFPYPYVGYTDYYCDGSDVTYGLVTGNQEYEFVANCD